MSKIKDSLSYTSINRIMNSFNVIVVIGSPASGKTYLSNLLAAEYPQFTVIHTDDYITQYGFVDALYKLMEDISKFPKETKLLIEGVLCYRLLRKGVEHDNFYPDCILEVNADESDIAKECLARGKSYDKIVSMQKANNTIIEEYKDSISKKYNSGASFTIPYFEGIYVQHNSDSK